MSENNGSLTLRVHPAEAYLAVDGGNAPPLKPCQPTPSREEEPVLRGRGRVSLLCSVSRLAEVETGTLNSHEQLSYSTFSLVAAEGWTKPLRANHYPATSIVGVKNEKTRPLHLGEVYCPR